MIELTMSIPGKEIAMAFALSKAIKAKHSHLCQIQRIIQTWDRKVRTVAEAWQCGLELQKSTRSIVALVEYAFRWEEKTAPSAPNTPLDFMDFITRCELYANYASRFIYPRTIEDRDRCNALASRRRALCEWQQQKRFDRCSGSKCSWCEDPLNHPDVYV